MKFLVLNFLILGRMVLFEDSADFFEKHNFVFIFSFSKSQRDKTDAFL